MKIHSIPLLLSVEQYFGLAGWQTWQTGRSVETKEVLTFNSSFLNKSLTWSFLVVSSPKWGVRSLCGKGTKHYSSLLEHMGTMGIHPHLIFAVQIPIVPIGYQTWVVFGALVWCVRSLCGKDTKYFSSLVEHMGTGGICTAKINDDESILSHLSPTQACSNIWCPYPWTTAVVHALPV